ncbi:DUF1467 family protein [Mesorhizobium sp. BR1-1-16]|jgi:predicted secreted protein|uniref:DUF1467 family protein n=1 Tax=Mesorhizobium sp. BR1-1-16 TaxID=2876653 RepID=UPI001CCA12A6|nr:DUF1467 family protein [Mesorhizobium sp. BR1-1-16]MBZ9935099.1 DUF1467 family protein [Mesorhizobium sp. BR1-1-16]
MRIYSLIAIYFIIWWLVIFTILPFGIRTQEEEGEVTLGTTPSAPWKPMLVRKAIITSIVSAILMVGLWYAYNVLGWTPERLSNMFGA